MSAKSIPKRSPGKTCSLADYDRVSAALESNGYPRLDAADIEFLQPHQLAEVHEGIQTLDQILADVVNKPKAYGATMKVPTKSYYDSVKSLITSSAEEVVVRKYEKCGDKAACDYHGETGDTLPRLSNSALQHMQRVKAHVDGKKDWAGMNSSSLEEIIHIGVPQDYIATVDGTPLVGGESAQMVPIITKGYDMDGIALAGLYAEMPLTRPVDTTTDSDRLQMLPSFRGNLKEAVVAVTGQQQTTVQTEEQKKKDLHAELKSLRQTMTGQQLMKAHGGDHHKTDTWAATANASDLQTAVDEIKKYKKNVEGARFFLKFIKAVVELHDLGLAGHGHIHLGRFLVTLKSDWDREAAPKLSDIAELVLGDFQFVDSSDDSHTLSTRQGELSLAEESDLSNRINRARDFREVFNHVIRWVVFMTESEELQQLIERYAKQIPRNSVYTVLENKWVPFSNAEDKITCYDPEPPRLFSRHAESSTPRTIEEANRVIDAFENFVFELGTIAGVILS